MCQNGTAKTHHGCLEILGHTVHLDKAISLLMVQKSASNWDVQNPIVNIMVDYIYISTYILSAVDGSEILNNHLGCTKPIANTGINYSQLVLVFFAAVRQEQGCTVASPLVVLIIWEMRNATVT